MLNLLNQLNPLNLLTQYILVWQLPVSLAIASLAIVSIRTALRKVRIGDLDMLDHGAVEQAFMATLWVGIAALVYPYTVVLLLGVWFTFMRRHLMTLRAWMASTIALMLCAIWYVAIHYLLPLVG